MKRTENLNLPIYDNPESDIFKINDVNNAHETIDRQYKELKNIKETVESTNPSANLQGQINDINASLDNMEQQKATKQEIEIERKRIDNLAKLEEGSTSGDAELIDGRVTYFGETSDSIGGAIRSQIGYLTSNLMERTDNLINVNTLNVGKSFNTSTLQYQNNSNWVSSEFIPVEPLTQYQFSCNNGVQLTCKAYSINEDKNYCFELSIKAGLFTTSEDTKYVVISTNNTTTVANYNTWVLVKANYKGTYIPYYKPKYENMLFKD